MNTKKTRTKFLSLIPPVTAQNTRQVWIFGHLLYVDTGLSWSAQICYIFSRAQQCIYLMRGLRSSEANKQILLLSSIIQSVMQCGVSAWYVCLPVRLEAQLMRLPHTCSKAAGPALQTSSQSSLTQRMFVWQVILRPTALLCYLKNIGSCHQWLDWTDWRTRCPWQF